MPTLPTRLLVLTLAAALLHSGCASYHRFRPTVNEHAGIGPAGLTGDMNDAAVLAYMDQVRDILRKRFHIARNVRQTAASAQILLAGAAGLAGAFEAGATTVTTLAGGSAAIPQLADVFDTGGRAIAYQQAVGKISEAESAYFMVRAGHSPVVPTNALTTEGALLLDTVNAATSTVELFQAGMLPTLEQMQRLEATELRQRAARANLRGASASGPDTRPARPENNAPSDRAARQAREAADALTARRAELLRQVEILPPGAAGRVSGTANPDDAAARRHLASLIESAKGSALLRLEKRVSAESAAGPGPVVIPPLVPDPVVAAPALATRRDNLVVEVAKLPAGRAGIILRSPALDDPTAKKLLTNMIKDAEDPLLGKLEAQVRQ